MPLPGRSLDSLPEPVRGFPGKHARDSGKSAAFRWGEADGGGDRNRFREGKETEEPREGQIRGARFRRVALRGLSQPSTVKWTLSGSDKPLTGYAFSGGSEKRRRRLDEVLLRHRTPVTFVSGLFGHWAPLSQEDGGPGLQGEGLPLRTPSREVTRTASDPRVQSLPAQPQP